MRDEVFLTRPQLSGRWLDWASRVNPQTQRAGFAIRSQPPRATSRLAERPYTFFPSAYLPE